MRHIILVLMFCVMGCAESHPILLDGDATASIEGDAGVGNDSSVDPSEDGGGTYPDGDVTVDAGTDAGDPPMCGTLPRDVATRYIIADTDCAGPMARVQSVDVTPFSGSGPATHCQTMAVDVRVICSAMYQTWTRVGRFIRAGLVYTSEPFEMGCEDVSYVCNVVHDAASNDVTLQCTYSGLMCEAHFTRE